MGGLGEDAHLRRVKADAHLSAQGDSAATRPPSPDQLRYAPRSEAHRHSTKNDGTNGAYGDGRAVRYVLSAGRGSASLYIYGRYTMGMTRRDYQNVPRHLHREA